MDNATAAAIGQLRQRLIQMEEELRGKIRSRRIAVIDEAGVERVLLHAGEGTGSVLVRLDRPEGLTTGIEIFAVEDPDGGGQPIVGMELLVDGDGQN